MNIWEHMLGVRPEVDGLRIDPCMPADWTRARMTRRYRGADYQIEIRKQKGICRGNVTVTLDGKELPENLIAPQNDGRVHKVVVKVGK